MMQHTITLQSGKAVTFGRRLTAADVLKIDADAQSAIDVQENLLHVRAAITSFEGVRRIPVPLSVLLQLDDSDRDALFEGFADFMRDSLGERVAESLSETEFKTAFGMELGGESFDVIEFTTEHKPLTGYDEVKLERQYGAGLRKELALIARETVKLSQTEGEATAEVELTPEDLERLDAYDFGRLREFAARRRQSFRRARKTLPGNDKP